MQLEAASSATPRRCPLTVPRCEGSNLGVLDVTSDLLQIPQKGLTVVAVSPRYPQAPEGGAPKDLAEGDQAQTETQDMKRKHFARTLDVCYLRPPLCSEDPLMLRFRSWSKDPQSGAGGRARGDLT